MKKIKTLFILFGAIGAIAFGSCTKTITNTVALPGKIDTLTLPGTKDTVRDTILIQTHTDSSAPLSINQVVGRSGYINTSIHPGSLDIPVGQIELFTGAGGGGNLVGMNLSLSNYSSFSDYELTKYAKNVSIWFQNTMLGQVGTQDFTSYNSVYSTFIPTSNFILAPNSIYFFTIRVSAENNIDPLNLQNNVWLLDATGMRYTDVSGGFQYQLPNIFGNRDYMGQSAFSTTGPQNSNTYFKFIQ